MARTSNTETRRAEIVSAMLAVIARVGYEKATTQAIARQAGLAAGLIHYHFENKQAILLALVQAMARAASARFDAVLAEPGAAAERLRAYLQARLALGDGATPAVVAAWVMIGAEAVHQPEVRAVYRAMVADERALLEALLADSLAEQGRDRAAAHPLASGLLAMIAGTFQLAGAAADVLPRGHAARAATTYAEQGIAAAPRRARA